MWGIADCDNCFVSCERVFRPDLNGKPVVVLSNNDGCVVARSNEAKALGVKMGLPYFQMRQMFGDNAVTAFSSNYELYGDMSDRIMSILRHEAPVVVQYSIDEAFLDLHGLDASRLKGWGEWLSAKIYQWTDMPVSIGIAPTKTLAKVASRFAKRFPQYNKCCMMASESERVAMLKATSIGDVWGIGRRWGDKLSRMGFATALDFANADRQWVRREMHITGERTYRELHGEDCVDIDSHDAPRHSICTSRSFPVMTADIETLRTYTSNFAAHCAQKLRRQRSVASMVTVAIDTNRFRPDLPQYGQSASLPLTTPSDATIEIVSTAAKALDIIFRKGFLYKRAAVIVTGVESNSAVQTDFTSYDPEQRRKMRRIDQAMSAINRRMGADTVILGSQQYAATDPDGKHITFANSIRRALKSPSYTRNPNDFKIK